MVYFKKINNIIGFAMFCAALTVYILTAEPTTSFWDCGEYISTAFKLQVGHPPGAPLFQLLGRFFSFFAFGNPNNVAFAINLMSSFFSALTIMFLFWTITNFVKRIIFDTNKNNNSQIWLVIGSGVVGALSYTFSDSFWFSAVEGEVYATSSFFTALTFWAILKWEAGYDQKGSDRWILLIALCTGLSIGVHLLNLLAIPALTMVYYFKKYKPTKIGTLLTLIISILIIVIILYGIIPHTLKLFAAAEILFVNTFGMAFNTGTIFLALIIILFISSTLVFIEKSSKISLFLAVVTFIIIAIISLISSTGFLNLILRLIIIIAVSVGIYFLYTKTSFLKLVILSFTFILIGYSSFLVLVIRSNAGTPINENAPKDAIGLLSYLNRDQYGDWPLFYGNYFNAPLDKQKPYKNGEPLFERCDSLKKYVVRDSRVNSIPNYDSRFMTFFPRMWSDNSELHISGYKSWGNISGTPVTVSDYYGNPEIIYKPTFVENLRFFFSYQLKHMYFRYLMWNFSGRQNDMQGHGGILKGNWITGINFIDNWLVGSQNYLPETYKNNKGRNVYYLLPFLLGLTGFFLQLRKDLKGFIILSLFFIFTGLAINIYLNPLPYQPRERDYAYAASFYVFSAWIGLGVSGLAVLLARIIRHKYSVFIAILLSFLAVPVLMAKEGWDDHDRSNRYSTRDYAINCLNTCDKDAILFTFGDNDTFPLWYAQEVEGIRPDIKLVNLSLLNLDWYIDQMKISHYESKPLPVTISRDKYKGSNRDFILFYNDTSIVKENEYVEVNKLIEFALHDDDDYRLKTRQGYINYFPTNKFKLINDSSWIVKQSWIPLSYKDSVYTELKWQIDDYGLQKNNFILLNILAENKWKRPMYFTTSINSDSYIGLKDYLQVEGLTYRLVPYKLTTADDQIGKIASAVMYENVMKKYNWGNINKKGIYLDETNLRTIETIREMFGRLATALQAEGESEKALEVCDKCLEVTPDDCIPYDQYLIPLIHVYYENKIFGKGDVIAKRLTEYSQQKLKYFQQFSGIDAAYISYEKKETTRVVEQLLLITQKYQRRNLSELLLSLEEK